MLKNLKLYFLLMRFDRPIGFLLLLWPTYWALWMAAHGLPKVSLLIVFTLGVIIMRAAGCVINDILDKNFDCYVERTCQRPLAANLLSVHSAIILLFILCLLALLLLNWLNPLTRWLSLVGLLLATIYPLLKRYTHLPQLGLGFAFSWGIPMAFAAQTNQLPAVTWAIFVINCLWIIAYDSEYAMADRKEDLKIGVKSTAILFGSNDCLLIGILQALVLILFWFVAYWLNYNLLFTLALALGLCLFVYQQYLIQQRKPKACVQAFVNNHWFGLVVFLGILAQYSY